MKEEELLSDRVLVVYVEKDYVRPALRVACSPPMPAMDCSKGIMPTASVLQTPA